MVKRTMVKNAARILVMCLALAAALTASGCISPENDMNGATTISGSGTIVYIDLEGGFYGLIAEDGTRYLPLNLDPGFAEDGLEVSFEGVVLEDIATIQQWGTPLEIIQMEAYGTAPVLVPPPAK